MMVAVRGMEVSRQCTRAAAKCATFREGAVGGERW